MVNASFNFSPSISSGGTFSANVNTSGGFNTEFSSDQKNMAGSMGVVNATSTNYNDLANKPSINNVTLVGNKTSEELHITSDKNFVYTQGSASKIWEIAHNLNKYCSVTVVDSAGNTVLGEIIYLDINHVRIVFASAFSGTAYCN